MVCRLRAGAHLRRRRRWRHLQPDAAPCLSIVALLDETVVRRLRFQATPGRTTRCTAHLLGDVRLVRLRHTQEHVFEARLRHGERLEAKGGLRLLKCCEDFCEGEVLPHLKDEGALARVHRLRLLEVLLDELRKCFGGQGGVGIGAALELDAVAAAVARLEVLRRADHAHAAGGHDADALREHVRLIHVVCREHYDPLARRLLDPVPDEAARADVHTRRRLIDKDDLGRATRERHGRRELALCAARELLRLLMRVRRQSVALLDRADGGVELRAMVALEAKDDGEMLAQRERLPHPLELRAEARAFKDVHQPRAGGQAVERRLAGRGCHLSRQHVDRRSLAGAIGPEKGEAGAARDGEGQVVHGAQLGPAPFDAGEEGVQELHEGVLGGVEVFGEAFDANARFSRSRGEARDAPALGRHVLILSLGVAGDLLGRQCARHGARHRVPPDLDAVKERAEREARAKCDDHGEAGPEVSLALELERLHVVDLVFVGDLEEGADAQRGAVVVLLAGRDPLEGEHGDEARDDLVGRREEQDHVEDQPGGVVGDERDEDCGQQAEEHEDHHDEPGGFVVVLERQRDQIPHEGDAREGAQLAEDQRGEPGADRADRGGGDRANADEENEEARDVVQEVSGPEDAHVQTGEEQQLLRRVEALVGDTFGRGVDDEEHRKDHDQRRDRQREGRTCLPLALARVFVRQPRHLRSDRQPWSSDVEQSLLKERRERRQEVWIARVVQDGGGRGGGAVRHGKRRERTLIEGEVVAQGTVWARSVRGVDRCEGRRRRILEGHLKPTARAQLGGERPLRRQVGHRESRPLRGERRGAERDRLGCARIGAALRRRRDERAEEERQDGEKCDDHDRYATEPRVGEQLHLQLQADERKLLPKGCAPVSWRLVV
mmetsp:Transcript_13571/g.34855  ORF Transcript_13571/g.34855 Transcript_13571/m.34855 type:complete len:893 (-) Transcript_13571:1468-4146(-)